MNVTKSKILQNWLGLFGWGLAAVQVLALLTVAVAMIVGGISALAFIFAVVILAASANAMNAARRRMCRDILGYIEQAVILNVPIPLSLWAAEVSETKAISVRLNRIRTALSAGMSLEVALGESVPEMPRATVRQVGSAERLAQLPQVLRRLAHPIKDTVPPEQTALNQSYLPAVLLMLTLVCSVVLIFVVPKFKQIFLDFKIRLPAPTLLLLQIADNQWLSWVILSVSMIWIGQILSRILHGGDRNFGIVIDYLKWYTPVLHRRTSDRGLASLCRIVSGAAEASWPMNVALREGAEAQENAVLRKRIVRWAAGIEAGASISQAARQANMPALIAGMLAPAKSADDLAQAMAFLSRHYETRFDRVDVMIQAAYIPIIVGVLGVCVGFICLSLLMPMAVLAESVANHMPGSVR